MKYLLIILAVLVCGTAGAETKEECQTMMDNCITLHGTSQLCSVFIDCGAVYRIEGRDNITLTNISVHGKSKRQFYIEKCEEYLEKLPSSIGGSRAYEIEGWKSYIGFAQIAQAYCTRALLEDK